MVDINKLGQASPAPAPAAPAPATEVRITVVEEQHQAVMRRVATEQITGLCQEFIEEFGGDFTLLPDGGLVPASLRIQRNKMGKIVFDTPKIGFKFCPYSGVKLVSDTQVVVKPSVISGG